MPFLLDQNSFAYKVKAVADGVALGRFVRTESTVYRHKGGRDHWLKVELAFVHWRRMEKSKVTVWISP